VNPILVQAFVSLGVVTQFPVGGGGDDVAPPGQGSAPGMYWSGLEGIGQRARDAIMRSIGDGWKQSGLALVRQVQDSLRAVDLVFALAPRNTPEGSAVPPQAPSAVVAEATRVRATETPAPIPNSDESESSWFSPFTFARAGVFLLGFAAAALCGKKRRDRLLPERPALKRTS
jgi:hypothetical protein